MGFCSLRITSYQLDEQMAPSFVTVSLPLVVCLQLSKSTICSMFTACNERLLLNIFHKVHILMHIDYVHVLN